MRILRQLDLKSIKISQSWDKYFFLWYIKRPDTPPPLQRKKNSFTIYQLFYMKFLHGFQNRYISTGVEKNIILLTVGECVISQGECFRLHFKTANYRVAENFI